MKHFILAALIVLTFSSCAHYKDIPYLQNSAEYDGSQGAQLYDMTIKPKDQLTVFVFSGTDKEAVAQFNMRDITVLGINSGRTNTRGGHPVHHYLVDNEGNIDFPILGKIHVAGFTVTQANNHIKELITPYLSKTADCVVNVNIENYEVTVMGEVARPNTFTVTRNKITVLEALAMAGDMTIYGKRNNVKLLREIENGEYEIHELDLRDANILNSPYYYLQQRDVLYVEPNETMAQNASIGRTRTLWVRGIQISLHLGSLLYRVLK